MLFTCQAGFESLLARELTEVHGVDVAEKGPGWAKVGPDLRAGRSDSPAADGPPGGRALPNLAFAHLTLLGPTEVRGDSVNALAARVAEYFLTSLRNERIDSAWPSVWLGPAELVGLGRRLSGVEAAFA